MLYFCLEPPLYAVDLLLRSAPVIIKNVFWFLSVISEVFLSTVTPDFLVRNLTLHPDLSERSLSGGHQVVTNDEICREGVIICIRGTYMGSWFPLGC